MPTAKHRLDTLNIRISPKESALLRKYCFQEDRTQSDVVREMIRTLESKLDSSAFDLVKLEDLDVSELPSLPYSKRKELPLCKAVYFVLANDDEILYIGQTLNLRVRWLGHEKASDCELKARNFRIAWIENPWAGFIRFEKAAIAKFLPVFNKKI